MKPKLFFEVTEAMKKEVVGKGSSRLRVHSIEVIPNFGDDINDTSFWVVLDGALQTLIPEWCLDKRVARNAEVEAFLGEVEEAMLKHLRPHLLAGLRAQIGFESRARVDRVGTFAYFR